MPSIKSERPRIYLSNVHLKGFKSIEDLSIDFQKGLNILIGKNGSGKSNFFEFISEVMLSSFDSKVLYNYANLGIISSDGHSFSIELKKELAINIEREDIHNRTFLIEKFTIDNKVIFDSSKEGSLTNFEFENRTITHRNQGPVRNLFVRLSYQPFFITYIQFDLPGNLECIDSPGTLKIDLRSLFPTWSDFKTLDFVDELIYKIEESYDIEKIRKIEKSNFYKELSVDPEIVNNLKAFTNIEDVRFNENLNIYKDEKSIVIENIKIEFKINDSWLPWSQLSDGTKRLLYIVAEITNAKGLVLIEEPELGIHPHQFNLVMDFLKEQSENKQIIISTHSPKALDYLSPEELNSILIANYDLKKGTQIRHLSTAEIKKAKKYMKEVGFFSDYWMLSHLE